MLAVATAIDTELDGGPNRGAGRERFCAVARVAKPESELIRFVVSPDGTVVPDLKRKLPGRGLWITGERQILEQAVARKVFARAFKRDVKVPPDLVEATQALLVRSVLDGLAMAGKAGNVAIGFAKAEAALTRDRVVGLLHASDASGDGVAKLGGILRSRPDASRIPVIRAFASSQLDLAFGRSNVVHAALIAGPANDTTLARWTRLKRFWPDGPAESGGTTVLNRTRDLNG